MQAKEILAKVDRRFCLDFLSRMVQHKSYSQTEGERVLAGWMAEQMCGLGLEAELTPVEGDHRAARRRNLPLVIPGEKLRTAILGRAHDIVPGEKGIAFLTDHDDSAHGFGTLERVKRLRRGLNDGTSDIE